jgi:hypothetical protein
VQRGVPGDDAGDRKGVMLRVVAIAIVFGFVLAAAVGAI